ncbi:1,3-beta-glucanosyltransferase gel1 [Aspergillus aculeatinus CBS 121060]|uniref:1,3-beta-glucanosyltransferase n=3 Tax=Aspergillus TaxID=5052 RepID=A0A8G1VZV2_9EURO|nr:glycolipid-anchored surface protein 5 precursor [Aspergillus brunneoviolaceus CBS 621.78]XP_025503073.1 glycolipid-anchored surface protein 5 precursor [Aspergillus aculeatinus CBS 121060]XP_040799404.1 glycolipid-anchored surface protein 5 precursor [Aspergillus fijiensis CBS 313.89]RAH40074.1 glycolipid-anchored surface protein 5 precursor [Aspergillus brunneoviolaceus CBS 621.78]RAH69250.1 glycolipid-anchored surface protein 5 precursor [Aspergillus aculeatinus CBS 121060]RAK75394.1 glyc
MKGYAIATAITLGASTALAAPNLKARDDVTPITVKGNAFFKGDDRFYIRGVDYQPGGSSKLADPIADAEGCKRDIAKFTELGLNTIRVYSVDNSADHDECMNALADAGIYLVLDVNTPKYSLNRADPKPSYNDVYLQYIFATVDKFANYKNTLAFFSGNEVINDGPSSSAAPYVKAVTRDLRQYIRSRKYREIPVGYSAADIDTNRLQMAQYMNCGSDDERSDFFAFNDYSWCDPSSFTTSGWDQKVKNFTGYGLPLFLSEYGCNTNTRKFEEVSSLYSTDMTGVYSGGLVYEYSEEPSNYGLVQIKDGKVSTLDDYDALKSALAKTKSPTGDGGYNKTGGANPCPAKDSPNWDVENDSLPAIPEPAKKYMTEGAGKGVGFSGSGSMNAGTASTSTATPGSGSASSSSGSSSSGSGTSTSSPGAAAGLHVPHLTMTPVLVGLVTVMSTLFGAGMVLV